LWGAWYLPLVLGGVLPWYDGLFFVPAVRVLYSWRYNRSDGSVPVVMAVHYAFNLLVGAVMLQAFSGSDRKTYLHPDHPLRVSCGAGHRVAYAMATGYPAERRFVYRLRSSCAGLPAPGHLTRRCKR
jgi:hypothetical protein